MFSKKNFFNLHFFGIVFCFFVGKRSIFASGSPFYSLSTKRINLRFGSNPSINCPLAQPVVSSQISGQSNYDYNYNPSYVPVYENGQFKGDALMLRCQNATPTGGVSQSVLGFVRATAEWTSQVNGIDFEPLTEASVALRPSTDADGYGTEDPRIAYREKDQTYYMFYTAVQQYPDNITARLALATTKTPWDINSWNRLGAVFPNIKWSKSGALLIRDDTGHVQPTHYLIWGDNNLTLATTNDLKTFTNPSEFFLTTRSDQFDSKLVESGPPPMRLSDKNYLFFYNSARCWYPSGRNNYTLQYNVGFVILDKDDPSKILQRSDQPLLSPQTTWEIGMEPYLGLTPNVVFLEAAKPLGDDKFLVFYGAADSVVGAAIVEVTKNNGTNVDATTTGAINVDLTTEVTKNNNGFRIRCQAAFIFVFPLVLHFF